MKNYPEDKDAFLIQQIPLNKVMVSALNTRKDLSAGNEDSAIDELAENIRERGLINPITVRSVGGGRFEVISGQRRLAACEKLGWETIGAIVRILSDEEATIISLAENMHRADMNAIDKARAIGKLMDIHNSMEKVVDEINLRPETVRKYLDLLKLSPELLDRVSTYDGPAKVDALSKLARTFNGSEDQIEVYEKIAAFPQKVQQAIIRESRGKLSNIDDLVSAALEGAFDARECRLNDCIKKVTESLPVSVRDDFAESCQPLLKGSHGEEKIDVRRFQRMIKHLRRKL